MSNPKQHHKVPRVYLDNFTEGDERITVWSKRRKTKLRPLPLKALTQQYYYSQPVDGQKNKSHALEIGFQEFETEFPKLYQNLLHDKNSVDIEMLLLFIYTSRCRSPSFREVFELSLADYVHKFKQAIPQKKRPKPPTGYEDQWENARVAVDPHRSIGAMKHYAQQYMNFFDDIELSIVQCPANKTLLTSDNPVVWFERCFGKLVPTIYPNAWSRQTRFYMPLSRGYAILGKRSKTTSFNLRQGHRTLTFREVNELNLIQVACAWDEIVGVQKIPKDAWQKYSNVEPRFDIGFFDPATDTFEIERNYFGPLRTKNKFTYHE